MCSIHGSPSLFSRPPPVNLSHTIISDTFYDKGSAISDALQDSPPIFPRDSSSRKAGPVEQRTGLVEAQLRHQLKEDVLQVSVWSCMLTYVPFMTTVSYSLNRSLHYQDMSPGTKEMKSDWPLSPSPNDQITELVFPVPALSFPPG